jgi:hypothetical protein
MMSRRKSVSKVLLHKYIRKSDVISNPQEDANEIREYDSGKFIRRFMIAFRSKKGEHYAVNAELLVELREWELEDRHNIGYVCLFEFVFEERKYQGHWRVERVYERINVPPSNGDKGPFYWIDINGNAQRAQSYERNTKWSFEE